MSWGDLSPRAQVKKYTEAVMMGYGGTYESLNELEPWKINVLILELARSYKEKMKVHIEAFKSPGVGL